MIQKALGLLKGFGNLSVLGYLKKVTTLFGFVPYVINKYIFAFLKKRIRYVKIDDDVYRLAGIQEDLFTLSSKDGRVINISKEALFFGIWEYIKKKADVFRLYGGEQTVNVRFVSIQYVCDVVYDTDGKKSKDKYVVIKLKKV